ncbi:hypothetical protein Lqui_0744 [Legionella quinlivanii]|uniref:VUT family protein n=1 Tax=Legionella quinlivanii TaxID=45073 RepID=A0A0W0Y4E9_9GAMM|nr:VUT family protein [Legionella quinlivanii]KTD51900.1 hypothetical protein Lqui_0744 [Legionella quinlivanii]MCW8452161.1 VUT family protein [Legionella quinlivanii]SEF84299.1 Putative vitamin uptake transporter [Legionella quinlivanii DSM 21216]STY09638.1 Uncharacterized ACR, YhhQ family COG1738 [Legionella quinlivanii]
MSFPIQQQSRNCLMLTVSMLTCLMLLINVSFKIINFESMLITSSSVLCPLVACFYLAILSKCSFVQQRHALNQSLLTLYLFSIGIYILVNLPAAEYMRDSTAYQIVFEDIPRKFFASTIAFAVSFYLPHLYCCARRPAILTSPKKRLLLVLFGGISFFSFDFLLLFADPHVESFGRMYFDSLIISASILLIAAIFYLIRHLTAKPASTDVPNESFYFISPWYHYLVSFAVTVTLISLSCEYRIVSFGNDWTLTASGIVFPLVIMASNLIGELYGYKANLLLALFIILAELVFDGLLMLVTVLPSPDFFDLTPFYAFTMPRRIPATILTLLISLAGNSFLLEKLKQTGYGSNRGLRLLVANLIVNSLLCLINYSLLFGGMYPFEQVFNLATNAWVLKFILTLIGVPFVLWIYELLNSQIVRRRDSSLPTAY